MLHPTTPQLAPLIVFFLRTLHNKKTATTAVSSPANSSRLSPAEKRTSHSLKPTCLISDVKWSGKLATPSYEMNHSSLFPLISWRRVLAVLYVIGAHPIVPPAVMAARLRAVLSLRHDPPGVRQDAREVRVDYRRNHHTMMKNQKTTMRKTMYHNQRHPCLAAMLFMRRKVPARMPPVSAKASFYTGRPSMREMFSQSGGIERTI